jgi:DNA modification methylase
MKRLKLLPKPDYQREGITLYCGDCKEILPLLPRNSIDAVVTDPPYGIDYDSTHSKHQDNTINYGAIDWDSNRYGW